ncbi:MAG TPA: CoA-binding protein, partial [Micromonosporaceae bacterium]
PEPVDLVNVFRPSEDAAGVVRDAVAAGAPAVWLQSGIASEEGRRIANEAGIDYVEDYCIAVERAVAGLSRTGGAPRDPNYTDGAPS